MDVFVGQTRGEGYAMQVLRAAGIGEIVQPNEYPPRRRPWMLDNGAWRDFQRGRRPDGAKLASVLRTATASQDCPVGVIVPDLVAGGHASLAFSLEWLDTYASEFPGQRWYLAVQDGMIERDVAPLLTRVHGVFVGGSTGWKLATGGAWARWAIGVGRPCHIGRCGSLKRLRWAREVGATSCDSSQPLFARRQLNRFLREVERGKRQQSVDARDHCDVESASRGAAWINTRRLPMPVIGKRSCAVVVEQLSLLPLTR